MTAPWLDIIGLGEDGPDGLSPAARTRLEGAEVIFGAPRHHALLPGLAAERRAWPSPFSALEAEIAGLEGRPVAVLVSGDPLWYSAGPRLLAALPEGAATLHPQLSAFQWAAARMGWAFADCETLTVHGRPAELVLPHLAPGRRLLLLTRDGQSPAEIAALLSRAGFGPSRMTVLAHLGGPQESRLEATAESWEGAAPDLHVLAIDCAAAPGHVPLPLTGLPDDAFAHDGKMTKQEIRAVTLAALAPRPGAMLWDIGLGCGSVAIEWMRAARGARAVGIESQPKRRAVAAANAARLGTPGLQIVAGTAPGALAGLPAPEAVFIGGGLSEETVTAALAALKPFGRLVANAVTLESEALLLSLQARHGGELRRISVARAEPVGPYRGWKPAMPVTQWSLAT
ncbi:precorrin-6y C5,15-methyltransferase (decarboxylating) subunit CbiE [Poseidonocella sp. HB161398]|uniref:precorrin-6y C5,15-methyltransferase (decarboxylating) subunit CbiE n=1 Tax=Poseidonocella sp. HB161398 TaxID=2320855 RepID=UPI0011085949|nr:precorrin-6y C5,15-methyltransferase (decarboxylating) subunit CbiE [Poseidonocella sp. HB161398]